MDEIRLFILLYFHININMKKCEESRFFDMEMLEVIFAAKRNMHREKPGFESIRSVFWAVNK